MLPFASRYYSGNGEQSPSHARSCAGFSGTGVRPAAVSQVERGRQYLFGDRHGGSAGPVSVSRKVLAKADQSRDFAIDKDTKVEGHLRVNARVSVRFKTGDDGVSHALHIIVRADARITGGPEIPRPPSSKK